MIYNVQQNTVPLQSLCNQGLIILHFSYIT